MELSRSSLKINTNYYSDTDSFVYLINHPDVYKWISKNKQHFDLSDSLNIDIKNDDKKSSWKV